MNESIINPSSLILHNSESQLIFADKNDPSQLFNFDLEKGQIVEQFTADKSIDTSKIRALANRIKNG
jgi:type IV secretory pathway VirB9-like protein